MSHRKPLDKVQQEMTPMIDVVFQLLTFFIMTFRVSGAEGDFRIKMTHGCPGIFQSDEALRLKLRVEADSDGQLANLSLNGRSFGRDWRGVQQTVLALVSDEHGPNEAREATELELDCDYHLRYEYVIDAITHVSGYTTRPGGPIVRLIEKVKFAAPRSP